MNGHEDKLRAQDSLGKENLRASSPQGKLARRVVLSKKYPRY